MSGDWKQSLRSSYREAIAFFGNRGKAEREFWVTEQFLKRLGMAESELSVDAADEPADTVFREARFQIKELVPPGRRRQEEYRKRIERVEKAKDLSELLEGRTTGMVTFAEIVSSCSNYTEMLVHSNKYGHRETRELDLLFYFNSPGVGEVDASFVGINGLPFRSVSVLSNRFAAVLFARSNAPRFLRLRVGTVYDFRE